jgi:two-component system, NtrC family, response regulator HydG
MKKILVVDDDQTLRETLKNSLEFHDFYVSAAEDGLKAVEQVRRDEFDLVVMDVNMPNMNGIEALKEIKKINSSIIVIILTAYSNINDAVEVVKEGAYNYLEKPIKHDHLATLIKRAIKARSLVETTSFSAPSLSLGGDSDHEFIGESNVMQKVFDVIAKLAKVNTPVLIRGESGTGKELVAKAIHYNGPRKDEKFVTINLAAIPDELIESELFGHEKGAFTGAIERKIGKFQFAEGGTLFLDEIGDISPQMQVKLLRVLQEKKFTPVGSNRTISSDVRIIAASHKPFEQMIKSGDFRDDLFYRLNVLPVYLPPLRKRKSDIPRLIDHYVYYFNKYHNLSIQGLTQEASSLLCNYSWPGNIRELRNVIEHAFIIESGEMIGLGSFPRTVIESSTPDDDGVEESADKINFDEIKTSVLDDSELEPELLDDYSFGFPAEVKLNFNVAKETFEKAFIINALKAHKGKINQTAIKAHIPKKTLLRKIEKYNINPKEYYNK